MAGSIFAGLHVCKFHRAMARKKQEGEAAGGEGEGGDAAGDLVVTPAKGGSGGKAGRKGSVGGDGGSAQKRADSVGRTEDAAALKGGKDGEGKRRRRKKGRGLGVKEGDDASASAPVAGLVFSKDGKCILATWLNKVGIPGENSPLTLAPPQPARPIVIKLSWQA